eukprot:2333933-Amphidinium_carterae.5
MQSAVHQLQIWISEHQSQKRRWKDDSVAVSSQKTPERSEQSQTCCKCEATAKLKKCQFGECLHMACSNHRNWIARDPISSQYCCHCCMPRAIKCYHCQRNGTQVLLLECEHGVCGNHVCVAFAHIGVKP